MTETRKGVQDPAKFVYCDDYSASHGKEAVELYNSSGRKALEWQEKLIYQILKYNDEGLWTHTKFGYSVPRRNGKNEIVAIREMYGILNGEKILHTAHRTSTSHSAWERILDLLEKSGHKPEKALKASGKELIQIGDGTVEFRTRTSKGGLGEGFDLLIIDEAQEYQDDQESALKYVVTSSKNPQTIFCGTPPTPVSAGTVFTKYRKSVLAGEKENSGWAEWSIEEESDVRNKELWYQTNPSLGSVFTERSVSDEVGEDDIDFNIQRLGLWIRYNQKSAISEKEWGALKFESKPKLISNLYIGIKYSHDGSTVSMSVSAKTSTGKIFIECIDCRPTRASNRWIMSFLRSTKWNQCVVDGASGQQLLSESMKNAKMKKPILPTVKEIIAANASLELAVFQNEITHSGQPSLMMAATNCEHRAIGSNGGFGYSSIKPECDITLLESCALAYWQASTAKEHARQKISY